MGNHLCRIMYYLSLFSSSFGSVPVLVAKSQHQLSSFIVYLLSSHRLFSFFFFAYILVPSSHVSTNDLTTKDKPPLTDEICDLNAE